MSKPAVDVTLKVPNLRKIILGMLVLGMLIGSGLTIAYVNVFAPKTVPMMGFSVNTPTQFANFGVNRFDTYINATGRHYLAIWINCTYPGVRPNATICFIPEIQLFFFNYTSGTTVLPTTKNLNLNRIGFDAPTAPTHMPGGDTTPKVINLVAPSGQLAPVVSIIGASGTYGEIISQLKLIGPSMEPHFISLVALNFGDAVATVGGIYFILQLSNTTPPTAFPSPLGIAASAVVIAPYTSTVVLQLTVF